MIDIGGTATADWMVDTFVCTAALIALVLLVRKRVAEYFGPQIAYALWALPFLRFVMPPLVLPAWMQPAWTQPAQMQPALTKPVETAGPSSPAQPLRDGSESLATFIEGWVAPGVSEAAFSAAPVFGLNLTAILLPLWLGGAAIFLGSRIRNYRVMRRDVLARARPVGEAGEVRLVETPAVASPVAFGIRDKVVALPAEFMDRIDVQARDMAIAHELEHHRGHDLLANIAAQPLLALHWFNPLAWWGWRAMRRDQEAACDARVVAGRARSERAVYAEVIAGFAAGRHLALAAPMACPVLGEKSIIHRLRSLTMNDISARRRHLGIAAITIAALALPLTASISYAEPAELVEPVGPAFAAANAPVQASVASAPIQARVQARVQPVFAPAETFASSEPAEATQSQTIQSQTIQPHNIQAQNRPHTDDSGQQADPDGTIMTAAATAARGDSQNYGVSTETNQNGVRRGLLIMTAANDDGLQAFAIAAETNEPGKREMIFRAFDKREDEREVVRRAEFLEVADPSGSALAFQLGLETRIRRAAMIDRRALTLNDASRIIEGMEPS